MRSANLICRLTCLYAVEPGNNRYPGIIHGWESLIYKIIHSWEVGGNYKLRTLAGFT